MTNRLVASIEGYAAVYGRADLSGDVIRPGAFARMLGKNRPIRMLYQHKAESPIGRWIDFRERPNGLYAYGEIDLVGPRQKEIHGLLETGALDGLSVGFKTRRARQKAGVREVLEADLWEVSVVTFPMASGARIVRVGASVSKNDATDTIRRATEAFAIRPSITEVPAA
ncbi:MAG: HK97 family phage prohead protease [Pseudomonadota bacterium]